MLRILKKISYLFVAVITLFSLSNSVMASEKFTKLGKGAIELSNADSFNIEADIKIKTKYGIIPVSIPVKFNGSVERGDDPKAVINGYYKFLTKKNEFSVYVAQNYYDINYGKVYISLPFSKFSTEFHNGISSNDITDAGNIISRLLSSDVINKIDVKNDKDSSVYSYKSDDDDIDTLNSLIEGKSSHNYTIKYLEENIKVNSKDEISDFYGNIKISTDAKISDVSIDFNIKFTNYNKPMNIVEPENADEYTDAPPTLNELWRSLLPF